MQRPWTIEVCDNNDGNIGHDAKDWSRRLFTVNGRSYVISLNLEAEK